MNTSEEKCNLFHMSNLANLTWLNGTSRTKTKTDFLLQIRRYIPP